MSDVADALDRAADLIEERGHTKGRYFDDNGFCVLGAFHTVISAASDLWRPLCRAVLCELDSHGDHATLALWNDDPSRTPSEVIDTLRFAAKHTRDES